VSSEDSPSVSPPSLVDGRKLSTCSLDDQDESVAGEGAGDDDDDMEAEYSTGEAQPTKFLAWQFEMKASFSARRRR
jgi:hypothetical protein